MAQTAEHTCEARTRRPAMAEPPLAAPVRGGSSRLSRDVASLGCDDEKDAVLATRIEGDLAGVLGASGSSSCAANASARSLCLLGGGPADAQYRGYQPSPHSNRCRLVALLVHVAPYAFDAWCRQPHHE